MFSCNLRCQLIFLHGRSRTYRVASLRAGPVGRISYNLYFDCKHVRYVTCDLINEYTLMKKFWKSIRNNMAGLLPSDQKLELGAGGSWFKARYYRLFD